MCREYTTERLRMRQWKDTDLVNFSKMNSDPVVMQYYPSVISKQESDALAHKFMGLIEKNGWGFWAVELKDNKEFIGFVGLHEPSYDLPVSPCVEIGWRLGREYWGNGYATEAAEEALKFAFKVLHLKQVYSFTSIVNLESEAVMKRLKMTKDPKTFNHPLLPVGSKLSEHFLYKIMKQEWLNIRLQKNNL